VSHSATLYFSESHFSATSADIDAFYVMPNGHIILSTYETATLGGLTFRDGDLADYDPDTDTATLFFSESHFAGDEDIDALSVLPNGHLVLSVERDTGASLGGLTFKDGDLIEYDPVHDTATLLLSEAVLGGDQDIDAVDIGCGNGFTETDEQCDGAGESATCNANCTVADCGDGFINASAGEQCDDEGESATCDVNCTEVSCGDGTLNQTAGEECDAGGESPTCDLDCTLAICGDGNINHTAGEQCDDEGESATCDANCTAAACGDGTLNHTAGEQCDDGNNANGDCCHSDCLFDPLHTACPPDTDLCTTVDECDGAGTCQHLAEPDAGCRAPLLPRKAQLRISDNPVDEQDALRWKWTNGAATSVGDFGDPTTVSGAGYQLCIYDGDGLLASADAPAGGFCAGKPCWTSTKKGFTYVDKELTPDGLHKIILQQGADGQAKIVLKGRGALLDVPTLPIAASGLPVTVQLKNTDGVCWEAVYSTGISKNLTTEFKAKSE
jgi:cysteine-rich repeat protein